MFVHTRDISYAFFSPALWLGSFRYCRPGGFNVVMSIEDIWHYMGFGAIYWNHNTVIIRKLYCDSDNHSGLLVVWSTSQPFVLNPVETHTVSPRLTRLLCTVMPRRLGGWLSWHQAWICPACLRWQIWAWWFAALKLFSHHCLFCLPPIPPQWSAGIVGGSPVLNTKP